MDSACGMNIKNIIAAEGLAVADTATSKTSDKVPDAESAINAVSPPDSPDEAAMPLMKIRFTAAGSPSLPSTVS